MTELERTEPRRSVRMIEVDDVDLCTESFGEPTDPPILLIMGLGSSMLWWDEDLCAALASAGRFVLRYDHRDTGRSTTSEPGHPGYTGADLVRDATGLLDAYGLPSTHIVGMSAGGGIAQMLALNVANRVSSLVLISTSPVDDIARCLPPPTEEFSRAASDTAVEWSNRESVVEYLVNWSRVLAGVQRPFDEERYRDLVRRDLDRARNVASLQNHDLIAHEGPGASISSIGATTLVVHGTADPMFPIHHGRALAESIPDATLLRLEGAGHGLDPHDWPVVASAIVAHTDRPSQDQLR